MDLSSLEERFFCFLGNGNRGKGKCGGKTCFFKGKIKFYVLSSERLGEGGLLRKAYLSNNFKEINNGIISRENGRKYGRFCLQ